MLEKEKISSASELTEHVLKLNDNYKEMGVEKLCNQIARKNKANRTVIENNFPKCVRGDYLFFGLFQNQDWMNDLLE